MSRRPNLEPNTRLTLCLPESVRARLDLLLFSELEGQVPRGKYQEFFLLRISEFLSSRRLSLLPWGIPGEVSGSKESIEALERKLNEHTV